MNKYIEYINRYKYYIVVFTSVIVALLSISLKDLDYEGSYKIWFDKDSKIIKEYELFRTTFSGDDTFIVAFEDKNGIFNKKAINTILELTSKFENIDGVGKVTSLSNFQYISVEDDEIIVENFMYDTDNLKKKKIDALNERLVVNQLISKDAKTTSIAIRLVDKQGSNEEVNIFVMGEIEKILKESSSGYKFYISGVPAITASLITISQADTLILLPTAVILVNIILFLFFRSIIGVIVPSIVVVFTFLVVISIQMLLGYKLNNFTVNIPAFITAVAIADAMHLYLAWLYYKKSIKDNVECVKIALEKNILPIALTTITTSIGFASLGFSAILPISTLGIAITSGSLLAFVFTVTIVPSILLMLGDDYKTKDIRFFNFLKVSGYGDFISRNDKKIVFSFLIIFAFLAYGLNFLKVDSNSIKFFAEDTTVRQGSSFIEKNLTGSMVYEIIIDSKKKDGVKSPKFLHKVIDFEKELKKEFPQVRFTSSLKDIIVKMQNLLNPQSKFVLPENQDLIAQYLLLYTMSLPQGMEINDKIDIYNQKLRLTTNSDIVDTSRDLKMIKWVNNWWSKNTSYSSSVQGQTAIFAYMQSDVTKTLITSISITLLLVALLMLIIFRDLKKLWLFLLPNIAPILFVSGAMGYLGINIDLGVAISAAVILSIAVDDSIHFFSKYEDSIKKMSFEKSIDYVISHSGNAMVLTTILLSITFSSFAISSFVPYLNFAIVSVLALNIALVLDLVLLPALLSLFYRPKNI